jgi:leucyl aminopeptidase (aminopeptidase T)
MTEMRRYPISSQAFLTRTVDEGAIRLCALDIIPTSPDERRFYGVLFKEPRDCFSRPDH